MTLSLNETITSRGGGGRADGSHVWPCVIIISCILSQGTFAASALKTQRSVKGKVVLSVDGIVCVLNVNLMR